MTNFKNMMKKFFLVFLLVFSFIAVVGCGDKDKDNENQGGNGGEENPPVVTPVTMTISASQETIKTGETVSLTVTVNGTEDKAYTWTVSEPTIVSVSSDDKLTVIGEVKIDKMVTVTATLTADSNVTASKTIKVVAPVVDGAVGELTSEMLVAIGNPSITVTGTITDYYQDFNQAVNSSTEKYQMEVAMSEGAWRGSWYSEREKANVLSDNYRKGTVDGLKDQYGNIGHALQKVYIDKDNKVAIDTVKDYISVPAIWEAQHLWNHLGNLQINKFSYDAENEVYEYNINYSDMDDLYLMTYLSYSLTPMLDDTLNKVYLEIENGEIVKLLAQTEIIYYGSETKEEADAMSYTTVELTFSNVGTTVVEDPAPYEAPLYAEKLEAALKKMGDATNYTFHAKDTTTYAPVTDGGEYEVESASSSSKAYARRNSIVNFKVYDNVSSVGTVGCFGQITESAALFANTGKYSYTMDGKPYYTNYTGYKQNEDGTFDTFKFNSKTMSLEGTKKTTGSMFDVLPTFEFSASVFKFAGMSMNANGKSTYTFILRDSAITRDVALEISAYNYADDAAPATTNTLTIVVDEDGNFVNTVYPYSLVSGTYMGYVSTTYSHIGTTELDADLFDGYIPRVLKTSWSEYITKYYSPTFSTLDSHEEATSVVLEAVYGDDAKDLPAPSVFLNILGDNISGPFYNWKEKGVDEAGNVINTGYISITVATTEYDENHQITNYEELMAELQAALEKEGFVLSKANTDTTGGASGRANRYVCFIKGNIQIVIENNFTKYLWIYFYKTGDWSLRR